MIQFGIFATFLAGGLIFLSYQAPEFLAVSYESNNQLAVVNATNTATTSQSNRSVKEVVQIDDRTIVNHVPLPKQVKNIYMTSCVAGTPSFRNDLIKLVDETEINSVIIDVKDYSGTISFPPESPAWQGAWQEARCGTSSMRPLIEMLHDKEVYVIARITVFQDPFYAKLRPDLAVKKADRETVWKDNKGLSFIDVAAKEYWDHIIELSVDSYNLGFDELNFDYVRYPSDGPMKDISFPHSEAGEHGLDKPANLEAFFSYLNAKLSDESLFSDYRHENTGRASNTPWLSADLFGMTTTNTDDLAIGQVLERAVPYFDFIAPMVYPSHYPSTFLGLADPNDNPYLVVNHAMASGVRRLQASTTVVNGFKHTPQVIINASGTPVSTGLYTKPVYPATKLRTWIQDFDYGGDYDAVDVRAQIQASYDAGVNDWMVWAPSNRYTRAAFKTEIATTSNSIDY